MRASTRDASSPSNRRLLARNGHVLHMERLTKLVYFPSRRVIVAQAGVSFHQVTALLHENGLSLPVNVALTQATRSVGAAFAGGALGAAGGNEGLFADAVDEVSIVDAFARLRVFSASANPHLFPALRLSLGLLGVVYDVTIRVQPFARYVQVSNSFLRLSSVVARDGGALRRLFTAPRAAGVTLVWFPYNSFTPDSEWTAMSDLVWVRTLSDTARGKSTVSNMSAAATVKAKAPPPLLRLLTLPQWLNVHAAALVEEGYVRFESEHARHFTADAFRQSAWVLGASPHVCRIADAAHALHFDGIASTRAISVALPVRLRSGDHDEDEDDARRGGGSTGGGGGGYDGWEAVHAAVCVAVQCVQDADARSERAVVGSMRVTVTVVQPSDALLAANAADGACDARSVIVTAEASRNARGWGEMARDVATQWVRMRRVRWVWTGGDCEEVMTGDVAKLQEGFDERVRQFVDARDEAGVDDYGMFVDERLNAIVGGLFSVHAAGSTGTGGEGGGMTMCGGGATKTEGMGESQSVLRRWQQLDALDVGDTRDAATDEGDTQDAVAEAGDTQEAVAETGDTQDAVAEAGDTQDATTGEGEHKAMARRRRKAGMDRNREGKLWLETGVSDNEDGARDLDRKVDKAMSWKSDWTWLKVYMCVYLTLVLLLLGRTIVERLQM